MKISLQQFLNSGLFNFPTASEKVHKHNLRKQSSSLLCLLKSFVSLAFCLRILYMNVTREQQSLRTSDFFSFKGCWRVLGKRTGFYIISTVFPRCTLKIFFLFTDFLFHVFFFAGCVCLYGTISTVLLLHNGHQLS